MHRIDLVLRFPAAAFGVASPVPVERGDGIAPVGTEYGTAKSQFESRIGTLLDQLQGKR